ncbi:MAG: U32 family peptidase, partial [Clostridiales bacterium]|nr:U32 family peptidase [Clostridiales bacterium]
MTELLAPAGSLDALYAAVNAGADAVYVGGRMFGARAYADNPDETELIKGIEYCHLRGKKVYLTVNTLLKERELFDELISFLMPLYRHGLDAVIVQDLGVLSLIKTYFPDLELHASTQMSVTTPEGAAFLAGHGVCRVVPARELSLTEIQAIVRSGMEVETFIHGSMCYSYSGRCLLSSMLGGRSGNRGRCAQPCRLPYAAETVSDQQNEKMQHLHKISSAKECILSMKDLCTLDLLPDLMDAGIASFKIEGRMKRPEYTAGVTSVYREYMDRYAALGQKDYQVQEKDRKSLLDLFDRGGFSQGYYHMLNGPAMIAKKRPKEESLQAAQSRNERNQRFLKENSKVKINGDLRIYRDSPVILELWLAGSRREDKYWIEVSGEIPLSARTMAASKEEVARQMRKTGGTAFEFEQLNITLEDGLFLPVRMLNELRREGIRKLQEKILFERGARQTEASEESPCSEEGECSDVSENSGMEEISEIGHISEISDASPRFTVLVTLASQLNAVLHWLDTRTEMGQLIDAVYLDSALLGDAGEMNENCSLLMKKAAKIKDRGI